MLSHRHDVTHGDVLPSSLGDEPRPHTVACPVAVQAGEQRALTYDVRDGLRVEGRAHPRLPKPPKDRALGNGSRVEPSLEGCGCLASDRLIRLLDRPVLVGLGSVQPIGIVAAIRLDQALYDGVGHLRAAPAATGPGEQQQRPIPHAFQRVIAGGQHSFQRFPGRRRFLRDDFTALGSRAFGARQQLANLRVFAGIRLSAKLVELGEHRQPVDYGVHLQRPGLALELALDQEFIDRRRQLADRLVDRSAGQVVDEELQHRRHGDGQGERLAIAGLGPGAPVAQGAAVAADGILGLAGDQDFLGGAARGIAKLRR